MTDRKFRRLAPLMMAELMREFRLPDWRAAAIAGNGGHESAGFTVMQEVKPAIPGSRGGLGYFQWTGARRRAFEAWATNKGLDTSSYEANIGFLVHELRGSESVAINRLRIAKTLPEAVTAFELAYERAGVKHYGGRQRWAEIALAEFRKRGANPKPITSSGTVAGAGTAAAGGAAVVVDTLTTAKTTLGDANDAWATGTWIGVVLGGVILAGAAYALYRRWDDAGRPLPKWLRRKEPAT